jgi:hypothetical protein
MQTQTSVTFPSAGYYRVGILASATGGIPEIPTDTVIAEETQRTFWIVVDEQGGTLTEGWDSLALAGRQPKFGAYGPFIAIEAPDTVLGADRATPGTAALLAPWTYSGHVTYAIPGSTPVVRRPLPDLQISMGCGKNEGFGVAYQYTFYRTNANGDWSATCPADRPYGYINSALINDYANVAGKDGDFAAVGFYDNNGGTFPDMRVANDDAAKVYLALRLWAPQAMSRFGVTRDRIKVYVAQGAGDTDYGAEYLAGVPIFYDERIKTNWLRNQGTNGYRSIMHEYGHALQWKAIEPPDQNDCGDDHAIDAPETLSCAFVEGFADFVGAWIPGDSLAGTVNDGFDYKIETNPFRTIGNGSIIEGAVAGFFYDLVDGTVERDDATNSGKISESFDNVTYPGSYLASIMKNCSLVAAAMTVSKLDGIDQVIYCAERSLAAQSLPTDFFPTRGATFTLVTPNTTNPPGWAAADVRRLWLRNLYDDWAP